MNNISPQLIQMLKKGGNPQQMLMGILRNNSNPMAENIIGLMNQNDSKGIEAIARNLCASRGINPDELLKNIQNQIG